MTSHGQRGREKRVAEKEDLRELLLRGPPTRIFQERNYIHYAGSFTVGQDLNLLKNSHMIDLRHRSYQPRHAVPVPLYILCKLVTEKFTAEAIY